MSDLVERGAQLYARIQVEDVGQVLRRLLFFFQAAQFVYRSSSKAGKLTRCSNAGRGCWSGLAPPTFFFFKRLQFVYSSSSKAGTLAARCSNPGRGSWSGLAPSFVVVKQELRQ